MPKTMSHTPDQRKAWHNGKRRDQESQNGWFRRVIAKRQFKGAYTPPGLKSGLGYAPLHRRRLHH